MEGVKKVLGAFREEGICINGEDRKERIWRDAEIRFNESGFDDSIENWIFTTRQNIDGFRRLTSENIQDILAVPGIYFVHASLVLKVVCTYYEKKKHEYKSANVETYEECLEGVKKVDDLMDRLVDVVVRMESKGEEVKGLHENMKAFEVELSDLKNLYKETHLNGERAFIRRKADELYESKKCFIDAYKGQENSYLGVALGDYRRLVREMEEVYIEFRKEVDAYYLELKEKKEALTGKTDALAVIEGQQSITASKVHHQFLTRGERASIGFAVILLAGLVVKTCYYGLPVGPQSSDTSGRSDGRDEMKGKLE